MAITDPTELSSVEPARFSALVRGASRAELVRTLAGSDRAAILELHSGSANPVTMFRTGRLKAKGDLILASNLANLFDLPKG